MEKITEETQAKYIIDTLNEVYITRTREDIYHWLVTREYESEEIDLQYEMALISDKELNVFFAKSAGVWIAKKLGIL